MVSTYIRHGRSNEANSRRWMTHHLDNTMDEFVLAFAPMTSNQSQRGILAFKEFG